MEIIATFFKYFTDFLQIVLTADPGGLTATIPPASHPSWQQLLDC